MADITPEQLASDNEQLRTRLAACSRPGDCAAAHLVMDTICLQRGCQQTHLAVRLAEVERERNELNGRLKAAVDTVMEHRSTITAHLRENADLRRQLAEARALLSETRHLLCEDGTTKGRRIDEFFAATRRVEDSHE